MSNKFKQMAGGRRTIEPRTAIPQVDPEAAKPAEGNQLQPSTAGDVPTQPPSPARADTPPVVPQPALTERPTYLTPVDTSEQPINRGFFMYPSRHRQLAKDLAYIEERKPWQIVDDALEEYVVKHYGKGHRRK